MKKAIPQIIVADYFSQFIKASITGKRLGASCKKVTNGTIKNYRYVQQLLDDFEDHSYTTLRILILNRASIKTIQNERKYWINFYKKFSTYLYNEKRYSDNYVSSLFKIIKTFFNYLQIEKGFCVGSYHKLFKVPMKIISPVVLQPERLQYLISNKEFEESLHPNLKRVKDIFVFGCTVALRVSDLMNLQKKNIVTNGNETYLKLFTKKTGAELNIQLPEYAIEIINRHKKNTGKFILPRLSVTNLNIQIKKLIKCAGWDYPLVKVISKQGKLIEIKNRDGKIWRFYEHITAHSMRRTAITTLLILGVPELVVRKLSGHTPGSKEFYRYIAIAEEYLNKEVKIAFKKLIDLDFSTDGIKR